MALIYMNVETVATGRLPIFNRVAEINESLLTCWKLLGNHFVGEGEERTCKTCGKVMRAAATEVLAYPETQKGSQL